VLNFFLCRTVFVILDINVTVQVTLSTKEFSVGSTLPLQTVSQNQLQSRPHAKKKKKIGVSPQL
jgi:hypothetical protein